MHPEKNFFLDSDPFGFDLLSTPINSSMYPVLHDFSATFDLGFDLNDNVGCEYEETSTCFDGRDLLGSIDLLGSSEADGTDDLLSEFNSDISDELSLELEFNSDISDELSLELEFNSDIREDLTLELELGLGSGLCPTSMDSEPDSVALEVNLFDNIHGDDNEINFDSLIEDNNVSHQIEEVIYGLEDDEGGPLDCMVDFLERMSDSSHLTPSEVEADVGFCDEDEGEAEDGNVEWEWEVFMDDSELDLTYSYESNYIESASDPSEDFDVSMEYDAMFGQLMQNDTVVSNDSPPTAKSVVANLPSVVLTKEGTRGNCGMVVCAICKDDIPFGEKVTKLPCSHLYHGDCIFSWLGIRNTCPLCRYELPTDDLDYERRRNLRVVSGIASGSVQ